MGKKNIMELMKDTIFGIKTKITKMQRIENNKVIVMELSDKKIK